MFCSFAWYKVAVTVILMCIIKMFILSFIAYVSPLQLLYL